MGNPIFPVLQISRKCANFLSQFGFISLTTALKKALEIIVNIAFLIIGHYFSFYSLIYKVCLHQTALREF